VAGMDDKQDLLRLGREFLAALEARHGRLGAAAVLVLLAADLRARATGGPSTKPTAVPPRR
jgi:hypothetical protein